MNRAVEWIKTSVGICAVADTLSDGEIRRLFMLCERDYNNLEQQDKKQIRQMLSTQFIRNDCIFVLSYFIQYMNIKDFREDIMTCLIESDYDVFTSSVIELQLGHNVPDCYDLKRQFHQKNVDKYINALDVNYPYLPYELRNKNRIVIITGQLLNLKHAPTKAVFQTFVALNKLGYEVKIFVCPCDMHITEDIWHNARVMNTIRGVVNKEICLEYKGTIIDAYQINMNEDGLEHYKKMLSSIYEFNPLFVYSMGAINPIADVANTFTTVVARKYSLGLPLSYADILVEIEDNKAEDLFYLGNNQSIFRENKTATYFEISDTKISRSELILPEDKFLIAIVGNRLDAEVNGEFINFMEQVADRIPDVGFVIIGAVSTLREQIDKSSLADKMFYLDYCKDLMAVYKSLDLYVNPKRDRGGFSALMALIVQLPVVTLPNCDVSYNVGEEYTVKDYDEMLNVIYNYYSDKDFYESKRKLSEKFAKENSKEAAEKAIQTKIINLIDYVKEKCNE